uniref:Uncharacterized protein n=1 Tax=Pinguiococcus pyrenoidosus TaxID=172671 RepID=A0A7R9U2K2_9STRA
MPTAGVSESAAPTAAAVPTGMPSMPPAGLPEESSAPSSEPSAVSNPVIVTSLAPVHTGSSMPSSAPTEESSMPTVPFCSSGVLNSAGTICCAESCGSCGSCNCAARDGGAQLCCPQFIGENGFPCMSSTDTGCTLPSYLDVGSGGGGLGEPSDDECEEEDDDVPSSTPTASGSPTVALCSEGIMDNDAMVCCHYECGVCGSCNCTERSPGPQQCCPGIIGENAIPCLLSTDTGCLLPSGVGMGGGGGGMGGIGVGTGGFNTGDSGCEASSLPSAAPSAGM